MGIVVNPLKAFKECHGYNLDGELLLWSEGVVGALSDEQELKCREILIENAKGGPKRFTSVEDALKAETTGLPEGRLRQVAAIRECAQILDRAEDAGLITGRYDVYATLDYCMAKLGYDEVKWKPMPELKKFIDEEIERLEKEGVLKKIRK